MRKFYFLIVAVLFLSCSKDDSSFDQRIIEPGVYKQSTIFCYLEDELGNCYDGGEPIILPEIFIDATQSASEENGRRESGAYIFMMKQPINFMWEM